MRVIYSCLQKLRTAINLKWNTIVYLLTKLFFQLFKGHILHCVSPCKNMLYSYSNGLQAKSFQLTRFMLLLKQYAGGMQRGYNNDEGRTRPYCPRTGGQ